MKTPHRWPGRVFRAVDRAAQWIRRAIFRRQVRSSFKLISCNCWGAEAYRELDRPYLTPFVGLFVPPESFLRLCADLDPYLRAPLRFVGAPKFERAPGHGDYPVATLLGEVEIHFMHYATEAEARAKWDRRAARLLANAGPRHFMFCDRDGCTAEQIARFDALPLEHKVCFTARPYAGCTSVIQIPECAGASCVVDGPNLYRLVRRRFDLASWLNGGPMQSRPRGRA